MGISDNRSKITASKEKRKNLTQLHPYQVMLFFVLAGITALFLGLTIAYLFSKPNWHWASVDFPIPFLFSILISIAISWALKNTLHIFEEDNPVAYHRHFLLTLSLSISFLISQSLGWYSLYASGVHIAGQPDGSYLYLISGAHALHVIFGIIPLIWFCFKSRKLQEDSVTSLVYFTNPYEKIRLKMLVIYWHFVDILWFYLLLFFLFNHL